MPKIAGLIAFMLVWSAAAAQPVHPERTIRLVAGTAPGGITDTLARVSADGLSAQFGR